MHGSLVFQPNQVQNAANQGSKHRIASLQDENSDSADGHKQSLVQDRAERAFGKNLSVKI